MPALSGIFSMVKRVLNFHTLKKESKLSNAEFWAAIGWLSKENKLAFSTEKVGKKIVKTYSLKD
uniref:winged helix-turn-helix domain-containing protein n=2 Tax=Phocaeicola plebeius TaxID=310297 RepID=UPI00359C6312